MPSWNIHTAHVEYVLGLGKPSHLGILDPNAFLFGNLAPDVYVGYMVSPISKVLSYNFTHLADADFIPLPDYRLFWKRYCQSDYEAEGRVSDVCLGAFCHLIADCVYNDHTNEFIRRAGIETGERTRIRKQGDFDLFGKTLDISLKPAVTSELLVQCSTFSQYSIEKEDVGRAVEAASRIVDANIEGHIGWEPGYDMLTPAFFLQTFDEVNALVLSYLMTYANGEMLT